MRLLLLDPGLLNRLGHHFHTDLAIVDELRRRGIDVEVFGNRLVEPQIRAEMPVVGVFRPTAYPDRDVSPVREHADDLVTYNRMVEQDLRRVEIDLGEDDVILVPTARDLHLSGMHRWYANLPEPRPRLVVRLMFAPWFRIRDEERSASIARSAEQLVQLGGEPGVLLTAESESLADYYQSLGGAPVTALPIPLVYPERVAGVERSPPDGLHLAFLGEARHEKGIHLLPDACARILERHPRTRLTIQTSCLADADASVMRRLRALPTDVDLRTEALSRTEYAALLAGSDLVLACYDPRAYRLRTSYLFLEAVGMGKPVAVTAGTWMEQQALELGLVDVVARDFTSADMAVAVEALIARWPEAVARARAAIPSARARHSTAAFVDGMLELLVRGATTGGRRGVDVGRTAGDRRSGKAVGALAVQARPGLR